ncbi:hypothetical protein [Microcoleus sp. Pol10D4]|uniref:hypothetical protein n=1 Tax=Microcoleus sp. Pol10D4 TaxID=3055387 RepID=UPI002FD622AB
MLEPIIRTEAATVSLSYRLLPGFNLQMDFNPIIDWFRLRGQFCILHWQAKPFGQRRWGLYDAGIDRYMSLKYCELQLQVIPQLLQVDENIVKTVPTAVLYFPQSKLTKNGYYSIASI